MNTRRIAGASVGALLIAASIGARTAAAESADPPTPASAARPAAAAMSEGEVRKVDREAGKLTLRHGPIASLDMPAMTMVFRVVDPRMLESLREGDKVRFAAARIDGAITLTRIEPSRSLP